MSKLVRLIDLDIDRYKSSLVASQTVEMLRMLREYLCKVASVLAEMNRTKKDDPSASVLLQRFSQMVQSLRSLEGTLGSFGRLDSSVVIASLEADLANVEDVQERNVATGRQGSLVRAVRSYYRLPPPVHLFLFALVVVGFLFLAYVTYPQQVVWTGTVTASILALLAIFQGSIREWARSKLLEPPLVASQ